MLSHVRFFATPWTVAHQALLSIGFPKQEYWSGLPFPPPGNPPDPGIKPALPASPVLAGGFLTTEPRGKPNLTSTNWLYKFLQACVFPSAARNEETAIKIRIFFDRNELI